MKQPDPSSPQRPVLRPMRTARYRLPVMLRRWHRCNRLGRLDTARFQGGVEFVVPAVPIAGVQPISSAFSCCDPAQKLDHQRLASNETGRLDVAQQADYVAERGGSTL